MPSYLGSAVQKKYKKINCCCLDPVSRKLREQGSTVLSLEALKMIFGNAVFFTISGYDFETSDRQKVGSMCIRFNTGHESIVCMGHTCSNDVTTPKQERWWFCDSAAMELRSLSTVFWRGRQPKSLEVLLGVQPASVMLFKVKQMI